MTRVPFKFLFLSAERAGLFFSSGGALMSLFVGLGKSGVHSRGSLFSLPNRLFFGAPLLGGFAAPSFLALFLANETVLTPLLGDRPAIPRRSVTRKSLLFVEMALSLEVAALFHAELDCPVF